MMLYGGPIGEKVKFRKSNSEKIKFRKSNSKKKSNSESQIPKKRIQKVKFRKKTNSQKIKFRKSFRKNSNSESQIPRKKKHPKRKFSEFVAIQFRLQITHIKSIVKNNSFFYDVLSYSVFSTFFAAIVSIWQRHN